MEQLKWKSLGGNLVHFLVLCCFITFIDFILFIASNLTHSRMPPNHFALNSIIQGGQILQDYG